MMMKKIVFAIFAGFLSMTMTAAGFSQELTFSGIVNSKAAYTAGAGDAPDAAFGLEEYANLRIQAKIRDRAVFYGAVNLIAAAGASAGPLLAANPSALNAAGDNYAAVIEPERLYIRLNGEYIDLDAGLMRLAFGFGQAWGPMDFLNPRDPRFPDARPRAVLGASAAAFPGDSAKLLIFGAAPRDSLSTGGGFRFGLTGEHHGDYLSVQGLYAYETPRTDDSPSGGPLGIHRLGLSLKAEAGAGLLADALYTYNHDQGTGIEGLAACAGLDYSFYDGKFYALAEYLYSGSYSSTAEGAGLANRNYLYALLRYSWNDYTNTGLAGMICFDDWSFSPILTTEYELFQGFTLGLTVRVPLDREVFGANDAAGELGPLPPGHAAGARAFLTMSGRLRF
ncbi:MAG: hypothetical protein LBH70_09725 [Spirochaetaceae bacterium]|jgi:hypothetical protein|nr:hypothetical protein [Spirochaetaceae bacterium]